MVFAVLVGQVGNGGHDAGAEELLPLVQVALVDFFEELLVSAHINRGSPRLTGARRLSKEIYNTGRSFCVLFFGSLFSPPVPKPAWRQWLTLESSLPDALSAQLGTGRKRKNVSVCFSI